MTRSIAAAVAMGLAKMRSHFGTATAGFWPLGGVQAAGVPTSSTLLSFSRCSEMRSA